MAIDIYQAVTDRILEILDRGTVPWRQPLRMGGGRNGETSGGGDGWPTSLSTGRAYRGINVFLLAITAWVEGYDSPYWATYRQALERGGQVRKGEKGTLVVFWKQYATKDRETQEPITVPFLRHFTVFNAQQCDGLEIPHAGDPMPEEVEGPKGSRGAEESTVPVEPIEAAQGIIEGYGDGPSIEHTARLRGAGAGSYSPAKDLVRIPERDRFVDAESYYVTLFHELAHSTGHCRRLDRGLEKGARFGSADYSKEELTAEMAAAFLAAAAGISPPTIEQSAAYIDGWRRKLSSDKKLVVQAAGAGQKAADWVLGLRAAPT